jgi:hypothetical protein
MLDRDRERGRDLERDVPMLRVEGAGGGGREVHLADGLTVGQERHREHAVKAAFRELPEDRRRRLHGGDVLDVAYRAPAEHLARREGVERNRSGGDRVAAGIARDDVGLGLGEIEEHDRAPLAGHHPPDPPQRGAADLRGRAGGEDRLPHVVEDGEPLGGAPEALFRVLPLGDVGDHPDRADQSAVAAHDRAGRHQSPQLAAIPPQEAQIAALAARGRGAGQRPLGPGPRRRVDEVVDPAAEHRAVLVAEQLGHALVHVGDHAAIVRQPDAFLRDVHQLLEPLLALLERAGPLLQP